MNGRNQSRVSGHTDGRFRTSDRTTVRTDALMVVEWSRRIEYGLMTKNPVVVIRIFALAGKLSLRFDFWRVRIGFTIRR